MTLTVSPPQRETAARWRRALARAGAPVLSGLALSAAFPPLDWWPLALVAPVPLLARWQAAPRPRAAAFDGFLAGVAFFGVVVVWTWWFGVVAYFPFVAVLAAWWAVAGAVVGAFAARGVAGPVVVASVWSVVEGLRGRWPFGGFSWGDVGYAFHDVPPARSVAAWGGHVAVTFLAVLVAAALARWRGSGGGRAVVVPLAAVVVVTAAAHALLPGLDRSEPVRVAVAQGNSLNRDLTGEEVAARALPRSHFALAGRFGPDVDLVVFPESSMDEDPRLDRFVAAGIRAVARRLDAAVLANASVEIEGGRRLHNTNLWYEPDGTLQGTYVKRHLVPFGEFVPGRQWLERWVEELEQIPRDHAPGDGPRTLFRLGGPGGPGSPDRPGSIEVATVICFESAFTGDVVPFVRDGARVVVVSTNNRSFGRSSNASQHLAITQMRAAEVGRPMVHAAISGRTAFVDEDGDVVSGPAGLFERTVMVADVAPVSGETPYVRFGQWVLVLCSLVVLGVVVRISRLSRGVRRLAP